MRKYSLKLNFMTHTFWIFKIGLIKNKAIEILRGLILLILQELMVCEFYSISLGKFYQGSKVKYIHLNWQSGALSRVCSYVPINLNSYLVRKHYANYFIFWTIRPRKRKKIYITEQCLSLQPPFISISILTL